MNTKRFALFAVIALCAVGKAGAQTYLDHLKQNKGGKGTVVVSQSKEIDDLVNGKATSPQDVTTPAKPGAATVSTVKTPQDVTKTGVKEGDDDSAHAREAEKAEEARRAAEARKRAENKSRETDRSEDVDGEMNIPTIDMRKKVMRGSRKVTGYRVQAFAGGNTRDDRQRAQQIGNAIKMKYPELPIYVHFYSPRWICRVGNFRSYQEAMKVLKQVKAMGYRSATIVSGKITVQY